MERVDRISALPNGVLCHILSFLPTHDAIATSLLSKRWQPLWHSVPVLDLDDKTILRNGRPYSYFIGFVYVAIFTRSPYHPLTHFRLISGVCPSYNDLPNPHFKIWLNAVVQRGLEHLHVEEYYLFFEVPSNVFTCRTLVVLKLCQLSLHALGSIHLPALKTLHLDYCLMAKTPHLAEVLSGCPILEDLRANNISGANKSDVVEFQSMPKLLRADICDNDGFKIPLKAVCNVEYLRFFLEFGQECCPVFHNLIHLELNFRGYIKWHLVFEMLKHCPKLQTFVLKLLPFEPSSPEFWYCPESVPECISSQLRKCNILNYNGTKYELLFAKYIMQNSRALRTMTIHNFVNSTSSSNLRGKLEMLQELNQGPRSSATCELLFK